ncbi:hypothetical protein RM550_09600, partial [Streptomyces sp. DSM 41527]|nr:hypothetical protein [Streptomyces sp. DSM 41527]
MPVRLLAPPLHHRTHLPGARRAPPDVGGRPRAGPGQRREHPFGGTTVRAHVQQHPSVGEGGAPGADRPSPP